MRIGSLDFLIDDQASRLAGYPSINLILFGPISGISHPRFRCAISGTHTSAAFHDSNHDLDCLTPFFSPCMHAIPTTVLFNVLLHCIAGKFHHAAGIGNQYLAAREGGGIRAMDGAGCGCLILGAQAGRHN